MRRMFVMLLICLMTGCAGNREWMKHDTAFASEAHWYFSWWGYKSADMNDVHMTNTEGWWGNTVFVETAASKKIADSNR